MQPLVQQKTTSEMISTIFAKASSASQSVHAAIQFKKNEKKNRQLLHRIRRTSSSSKPRPYLSRITKDEEDTAAPGQRQASKHMHGIGHDSSHNSPGCRQQHPPK
eukprot:213875_1